MSETYEINERNEVIPYTSGSRCNDTRAWRDATDLELQQRDEITELEKKVELLTDALEKYRGQVNVDGEHTADCDLESIC